MDSTLSFRVDDDLIDYIDALADEYDTTRSEIARHLLDNGSRAHKYYPGFDVDPDNRNR